MSGLLNGKLKRIVGSVSVGSAPKRLKQQVQAMVFQFDEIANLTQAVSSPSIRAFGYEWQLHVYPMGAETSSDTIDFISCQLHPVGGDDTTVFAKCSFRCKDQCKTSTNIQALTPTTGCLYNDFLARDGFEKYLNEEGTLVIEIDMQITVNQENGDEVWYPKLNIPNDVLTQIYHFSYDTETNTADAAFEVDGTQFQGHTNILSVRSPAMYELMKDNKNNKNKNNNNTNNDGVVVVPIPNMESDIFEGVLKFIYCV